VANNSECCVVPSLSATILSPSAFSSMRGDFFKKLKSFDAYPKTLEDFRVRTVSGAAGRRNLQIYIRVHIYCFPAVEFLISSPVSIISGLIITWLFFSELSFYLSTDVQPELFVDTSRGEKLRINMDVTFPDLPCGCASRPLSHSLRKPLWPQHPHYASCRPPQT